MLPQSPVPPLGVQFISRSTKHLSVSPVGEELGGSVGGDVGGANIPISYSSSSKHGIFEGGLPSTR
eukprot:CAMPEP_0194176350 /NCGR_PEP_ID=MMETSP0154-20130528/10264_1 /TAXON_ID=1049557 /ORGANISM="Thalassiothrix antarctica, Strain L6-D1" /LENGTH=65 /DNA_ID=CAMNT_0038890483 /DNA_START=35 /DNA_END=229 /DNA_ORIENTATION=-